MEKKILFGTLAGAITGTVAAMAIFMGLLGSMAEKWYAENSACVNAMEDAPMWAMIVASLVQGLFLAVLLYRFGVSTFKGGLISGGWITLLMVLWYGLLTYSTFNAYTLSWLPIDVIGNTICGALAGGVIGWVYGKVK
jgi:TRAP-type mannitol/chloroaromatic compound transport system permease large subunit